jgi:hypothetical protein
VIYRLGRPGFQPSQVYGDIPNLPEGLRLPSNGAGDDLGRPGSRFTDEAIARSHGGDY